MALAADDKVQFDAVPCEPSENNSSCPWFATLVWKGKRPSIDYDAAVAPGVEPRNFVADIKHVSIYNCSLNKLIYRKNCNTASNGVQHGQNAALSQ